MGASAQEYENWRETLPKKVGLEYRYDVKKNSDPEGKHRNCRYFVLDPTHDVAARKALHAYAAATDNEELAKDLYNWLWEVDDTSPHVTPNNPTGTVVQCDRRDIHEPHEFQYQFGSYFDVYCPGNKGDKR